MLIDAVMEKSEIFEDSKQTAVDYPQKISICNNGSACWVRALKLLHLYAAVAEPKPRKNKIYRYDPDGETIDVGDTVTIPTRDASRNRDAVRHALVAHWNNKALTEAIKMHSIKKSSGSSSLNPTKVKIWIFKQKTTKKESDDNENSA